MQRQLTFRIDLIIALLALIAVLLAAILGTANPDVLLLAGFVYGLALLLWHMFGPGVEMLADIEII